MYFEIIKDEHLIRKKSISSSRFNRPRKTENSKKVKQNKLDYTLIPEIKEWLHSKTNNHWFLSKNSSGSYMITFCNDRDAMFYRLTWSGHK